MMKDCTPEDTRIEKLHDTSQEDTYAVESKFFEATEQATVNAKDQNSSLIFGGENIERSKQTNQMISLKNPDQNLLHYKNLKQNTDIIGLEQKLYRMTKKKKTSSGKPEKSRGGVVAILKQTINKNFRTIEHKTCVNVPVKSKVVQKILSSQRSIKIASVPKKYGSQSRLVNLQSGPYFGDYTSAKLSHRVGREGNQEDTFEFLKHASEK